jgi:hypothetical protein
VMSHGHDIEREHQHDHQDSDHHFDHARL